MTERFKVGDKVKCIKAKEGFNLLKINHIYTIKYIWYTLDTYFIVLKEIDEPHDFNSNRFTIYNKQLRKDKLKKINNE